MSRDVTTELIRDSASGPGEQCARVAKAKPAKELTPRLTGVLASVLARNDRTMGNVSKALAYSRAMPHRKGEHADLIRLFKGGHLRVLRVEGKPPPGSTAKMDSPYGDWHYLIEGPA